MRELREGQPSWVVDPIEALVQHGKGLKYGDDREIGDLLDDYTKRVSHAAAHKLREDAHLIAALQARYEGDFAGAIAKLDAIKRKSQRVQRLYAQSLRDLFNNEQEGNDVKIEQAVMAYQKLVDARTNEFRLSDQVALIEALIDIYERRAPTKPLTKEDKEGSD